MEITITEKKEQPLLSRQEVLGKLTFSGVTPSKKVFRKELAKKVGVNEELLVLKKIEMIYGHQAAYFNAMIYKKKEDLQLIEAKATLKKNFGTKEEKPAEENAEPKEKAAEE
jgi:ribosomal protein S24E